MARQKVILATVAVLAAAACGGFAAGGFGAAEPSERPIEAVTKPSEDVTLSFARPGRVAKISVKEGQLVEANQELVRQDDTAEQVQIKQLKSQADSDVRVRAAKAQLDQKVLDHQKVEDAYKQKAAPLMEVEHARLDVDIAKLSLELAQLEHEQDVLKYEEARAQIDRMRIVSPIAGMVEKLALQEGESRDAQQPIVRVVKIQPLWIDAPVRLREARGLAVGMPARVDFPLDPNLPAEGKIVHVASVADPASDTLLVRVELKNPRLRKAGERVLVSFPSLTSAARDAAATAATQPK